LEQVRYANGPDWDRELLALVAARHFGTMISLAYTTFETSE
jgi:hypothetical protein